jgi:hypothetical protein
VTGLTWAGPHWPSPVARVLPLFKILSPTLQLGQLRSNT